MNKKTNNTTQSWSQRAIKGRVAETLIEQLFSKLGYKVFHYGMEKTIPGIIELLQGVNTNVAKQIRTMPDFVMQHAATGDVSLVEVKYRANGKFSFEDIKGDYPYENAFFVIVSRRQIKCLTFEELKKGQTITATSRNYLYKRQEFELNKDVIKEFCGFAVQFFTGVE
ncbi:MAG: hypothetical protein ACJAV5_001970 [Vicingaceae bacterium]|jgi:hypothetical protein